MLTPTSHPSQFEAMHRFEAREREKWTWWVDILGIAKLSVRAFLEATAVLNRVRPDLNDSCKHRREVRFLVAAQVCEFYKVQYGWGTGVVRGDPR